MPEPPDSDHGLGDLEAFTNREEIPAPDDDLRAEDLDVFARGETPRLPLDEIPLNPPDHYLADLPTMPPEMAITISPEQAAAAEGVPHELIDHPRYRIVRLLGSGGMGSVYQAEHRLMDRPVALKVIRREMTASREASERFVREVRAAGRLHHPNVVTAFDAEQEGELHFLAMEYVEGCSLAEYVRRHGPLPIAEACDYVRQAAVGLQYAHEKGMVHRDVKPDNLMRTPAGQIKILDFGIARFAHHQAEEAAHAGDQAPEAGSLTLAGSMMGTPDYVAPEQVTDSSTVDGRADVYSLGCTLYFLLTGRPPFPDRTAMEKMHAHRLVTPTPLRQLRPEVPAGLAAVVEKMMAKKPADRYQTPGEAAAALAPFVAGPRPRAWGFPWLAVAMIVLGLVIGGRVLSVAPTASPAAVLMWGTLAVLGVGGGVWMLLRKRWR